MRSFSEQLVGLGLASDQSIQARSAREQEEADTRKAAANSLAQGRATTNLYECANIGEFRRAAKDTLLADPTAIAKVITAAHNFKDEPGGSRIVWEIYQVRNGLQALSASRIPQFLDRAFRRSRRKFNTDF